MIPVTLNDTVKNINVIVVDDSNTMRKLIRNLLNQIGFNNVDESESALKALKLLENKKYGLVLTDCNMPEVNGLEFTKRIRSHSNQNINKIPVIMITAESKTDVVIEAKKSGVNNYVVKPFTVEGLEKKITLVFNALKLI